MAHEFQRVVTLLDRADEAAAGGKQRELLEYAIRLLSREFIALSDDAGIEPRESVEGLVEIMLEEKELNRRC